MQNTCSRVVVFSHFDIENTVDPYVMHYLKYLKEIARKIIFVTTSKINDNTINKLYAICDCIIVRDNSGYDFMSYKLGLGSIDNQLYDEIILCNDSVYGPFFSLKNMFLEMDQKDVDFWGITSSNEISFHLQSYFLVFKKQVFTSKIFQDFWNNMKTLNNKREIINKYEIGLSQKLILSGFVPAVYSVYKASLSQKINLKLKRVTMQKIIEKFSNLVQDSSFFHEFTAINNTHTFWKELILIAKMPFIKIELLRDNPIEVDISDYKEIIKQVSNYDILFIENHLKRIKKGELSK